MKKVKGFIIAGSILLGLGTVTFIIFMSTLGWDFSRLDTEVFTPASYVSASEASDFTEVVADVSSGTVVIRRGEALRVEYAESEHVKTSVTVENGKLSVRQNEKFSLAFFRFNRSKIETVITLPDGVFTLDLETNNGKIIIDGGVYGNIEVETDNGRIQLNELDCEALSVDSDNGAIEISKVTAVTLDVECDNGKLTATDTSAAQVTVKTSNGNVELKDVVTDALSVTAKNGRVILNRVTATQSVEVKSNNGRIEFDALLSNDIRLICYNGRIEGTVKGVSAEFRITTVCKNGDASVPGGSELGQYALYAQTNNGNIEISFVQ